MAVTEKNITLCGHGSKTPSLKNMDAYLTARYASVAANGKRKGVVKVMRLKALSDSQRKKFHDTYKILLGRNAYDQSLRSYVYTPKSGKYYSDCSSSGMATFKEIGCRVTLLNTAGIYNSGLFEEVPVIISKGHITNPDILKVADAVLFVGNDPARPLQIGHVEFVYEISGPDTRTAPTANTKPKAYTKTQFIKDVQAAVGAKTDGIAGTETLSKTVTLSAVKNSRHKAVKPVQQYLNALGYSCGPADGIFGAKTKRAVINYQKAKKCIADGEITKSAKTWKTLLGIT